ncbi:magnesium and cobalt transport protein CorA [Agromyces larvae]|uniref:Magnesium and cobalt transport protein CorA n=1 Tax=Agromyces larvae TaxID=2929802 RepID=A0ABY4C3G2_9MICO|nr:magnesium and cobalt transport protein CorA [Agromyces larvae]UOE43315.1 magnesium and cobalt transport protein CorA [Agromyces larvae]
MAQRRSESTPFRRLDPLRRRTGAPRPDTATEPQPPKLMRYVTAGEATHAPASASVADGLEFADAAPDHLTIFFYPSPTPAAVREFADAWELHPLLVEDLLHAGQRPKLERYGDVLFLVVRSARYIDEDEEVDFAEFHIVVGQRAVALFCQDRRWIDGTDGTSFDDEELTGNDRRERTLTDEHLLQLGPEAVVYRLLDEIVDGYAPVLKGIAIDKEQIERQVFSGDPAVAERIYRLSQEVIDMQHTTASLTEVLDRLRGGFGKYGIPDELQAYLQDVSDHLARANAQVAEYRDALSQILSVNSTLVAQRQNEDMKKISGWAAILFAPTLIAAIYGMNFDWMPELHWAFGYPLALALMVGFALVLYWIFKRSKWM